MNAPGWRRSLRWPVVSAETAQLAGWTTLALNSVLLSRVVPTYEIKANTAVLRDLVVVGHLVTMGTVAYLVTALWRRLGPKRPIFAYLGVTLATIGLAAPALYEDLSIAAGKIGLPSNVSRVLLIVAVSLIVPIAAFFGRLVARPWLHPIGLIAAIGLGVANHLVFPEDYMGVHLAVALAAATLFGTALATREATSGRASKIGFAVMAPLGIASLVIRPTNSVALAVQHVPGDVVATWRARMRGDDDRELDARTLEALVGAPQAAWWKRNPDPSPIAASTPSLLPDQPIVILITVDCLRADVIADAKRAADLPSMFALRDASVDFTETRATATATAQSVSSIFTGAYYSQLYWTSRPNWNAEAMYPHADPTPRFPELLVKGGVRTTTISGMAGLSSEFGVVKGFEEEKIIQNKRGFAHADQISPVVLARLSAQGNEPFFLYVHYTDAHAPYAHGTAKGSPFEQYLKGLALVDKAIGELLARVDGDPNLRERTTIMLSADHGEAFGEHRSRYHATTVYEELLRVPLLMRIPGVSPRKVKRSVSLIDLAPTMLDLFGQSTPRSMMGQSLVPFLRGEDPVLDRPIIADTSRLQRALIFPDGQKIIHDRRRDTVELFDLRKDPIERRDLFDQSGVAGENRLLALQGFFKAHTLARPGYKVPYGR